MQKCKKIGLMVFYTLPILVEFIVIFIFGFGLLYREKQSGNQSKIIEVLVYDIMWLALIKWTKIRVAIVMKTVRKMINQKNTKNRFNS